jgi:hypothetical protein
MFDPALVYLFTKTQLYRGCSWWSPMPLLNLSILLCWIMLTKVAKVYPYYARHPEDIPLFPYYVLFAYFHSFLKAWAMITFWDCSWSGRNLKAAAMKEPVAAPSSARREPGGSVEPGDSVVRRLQTSALAPVGLVATKLHLTNAM